MSAVFRTPEQVAPELGMTKTELRRYAKESGIHTRLSKNRIALHQDDIEKLVQWVMARNAASGEWANEPEAPADPFK